MRAIGFGRRVGLFLPVALGLWAPAAAAQDPADNLGRRELVSPPGWFGPGPAWHKWNYPGPGLGWTYYGVPDGPYVTVPPGERGVAVGGGYGYGPWGVPSAAGSFWTNGLSLYGPPVPTYGPIPGVFGAGDANRLFFKNPPPASSVWFGLGWFGSRTPSPRHVPINVSVWPVVPPSVQAVPGPPVATPDGAPCIRLAVRLPDPNADLWVEKVQTAQKGVDRVFDSPPLEAGKEYRYELVARWTENGKPRAESRTAVGTAGQTISIDFTRPAEPPAVAAKP